MKGSGFIAFLLWLASGVVGGFWLGLMMGGRVMTVVFGVVLGVGLVLIFSEWMFARGDIKSTPSLRQGYGRQEPVLKYSGPANVPKFVMDKIEVSEPDVLEGDAAREWLDDFLVKQQGK